MQSSIEPGSEKFKEQVADESGYGGNFKIRGGKDVADRPGDALLWPMPERSNSPIKRLE
jgi:hypothetical protein